MDGVVAIVLLLQALRISLPYVLAALGGTFSERGGVVNIALEGIMLSGAFAFVFGTWMTGSPGLGLLAGMAGGAAIAALLGLVVLRFKADPVVSGVALNLLAVGVTRFLLKLVWGSSSNSVRIETLPAFIEGDGTAGALLGMATHPLFLATVVLVTLGHVALFRMPFGLRLRACGEHPEAARSAGIPVTRMRLWGVLLSGALAGLAGTWLANESHQFTDNMTGGRGYIALAAMIFGRWKPVPVLAACLLFGAAETAQIALQGGDAGLPTQLVQMLPYVLTLVTLVLMRARRPGLGGGAA